MANHMHECIIVVINLFIQHPDVVHAGVTSLLAINQQHSEIIFGVNVSQTPAGKGGSCDRFTSHLGQMLHNFVQSVEAQSDVRDETVIQAFKLVVHKCPFIEVLRCILSSKHSQRDLLLAVLDEVNSNLAPAITEWLEIAEVRRLEHCASIEVTSFLPPLILTHVKATGGVGIEALHLLEEALQKPGGPTPKLPFLFEWAQSAGSCRRSRIFLLGILFSPSVLISRLAKFTSNQTFFAKIVESLLDLNSLEGFDAQSQREVGETLIDLVPQTPNGCVAWAQALQIFLLTAKDSLDQDLIERATDEIIAAVRWAVGRQGWSGFIFQALSFATRMRQKGLMHPQNKGYLQNLACLVHHSLEHEVQADTQAQLLLSLN